MFIALHIHLFYDSIVLNPQYLIKIMNIAHWLDENGLLAQHLVDFSPREQQMQMARMVEEAIAEQSILICEAGTGTGKTFAYLIPALLADEKVIISTGTKNLQEQLFHRDLPILKQALSKPLTAVLLKGRANYLCLYRMELHASDGRFTSKQQVTDLQQIVKWQQHTQTGDLGELSLVKEDSDVWPLVTSTVDNCLMQQCPMIQQCFLVKARRKAKEADLLVVNHHLFFADQRLKEEGVTDLLPGTATVILDEAHQLLDAAMHFFGMRVSSREWISLFKDLQTAILKEAQDVPVSQVERLSIAFQQALQQMRETLPSDLTRAAWASVENQKTLQDAIQHIKELCTGLNEQLSQWGDRGAALQQLYKRSLDLTSRFLHLTSAAPAHQIHWFETFSRAFSVHWTPLNISEQFEKLLTSTPRAWIFTSATLSVEQDDFSHFQKTLGLTKQNVKTLMLESPFDYPNQALLYVPRNMPDPSSELYTQACLEAALPVLKASQGRAFMLFTSHRALQYAAQWFADKLPYLLLVQGESSNKSELLRRFCDDKPAVLLATGSFWEGVDVRGSALSCVIIDRLPFVSPEDPINKVRIQTLKKQGQDPFNDYQLPQAMLMLKQGAGRLIRSPDDKGVLMVCDPRLVGRPYGQKFLQALPAMRRTRDIDEVSQFFEMIKT